MAKKIKLECRCGKPRQKLLKACSRCGTIYVPLGKYLPFIITAIATVASAYVVLAFV